VLLNLERFQIGIIEGFFGQPWPWKDRHDYAGFLASCGYAFYIYAPKSDPHLRKAWKSDWPETDWNELKALRERYAKASVAFGIGLSPYGLVEEHTSANIHELREKVRRLNALEPDLLAILFDDMPTIDKHLAKIQTDIVHETLGVSRADAFLTCPTFYSDDPVLERMFCKTPEGYLQTLGAGLDEQVRMFWTGPRVCSEGYADAHLTDVASRMGRKPFLWDNYPVNDGPKMCKHLHLRAFTGRTPILAERAAGIAANPMNQAHLSKIPLATLPLSLSDERTYDPEEAFRSVARQLGGEAFARALLEDLSPFQDDGLDRMSTERRAVLRAKYAAIPGPFSAEILRWLEGGYAPSVDVLEDIASFNLGQQREETPRHE